jgi:hypothetical protein
MFIPQPISAIVHGLIFQPFENGFGLIVRRTTIGLHVVLSYRKRFKSGSAHLQEGVADVPPPRG